MDYYGDRQRGVDSFTKLLVESQKELSKCLEKTVMMYDIDIINAAYKISYALTAKRKVLLFGNGGSAADCQHLAAEFIGRFLIERDSQPAISLTTDTSILTAVGNDYGFDQIFKRQIQGLGRMGDVAIAISTSGNSPNVLEGIMECKKKSVFVVGFTGANGGMMGFSKDVDICIKAQSNHTPHIQETHIFIGHMICDISEKIMFPEEE